MIDQPTGHFPDRLEIEVHIDPDNMARSTGFSIPLYRDGKSLWRQGLDTAGEIDVAVIEVERSALPKTTCYRAFTPEHLLSPLDHVEVGTSLLVGAKGHRKVDRKPRVRTRLHAQANSRDMRLLAYHAIARASHRNGTGLGDARMARTTATSTFARSRGLRICVRSRSPARSEAEWGNVSNERGSSPKRGLRTPCPRN